MSETLFDLEDQVDDDQLDLAAAEWASCRFCQVLSTAAGIVRHEHGEGSSTCARYVAQYGLVAS